MHYANGRAPKVGDLVRGKGYNFKHEIVGILVEAHPEADSCNCQISCIGVRPDWPVPMAKQNAVVGPEGEWLASGVPQVESTLEYGQLDAFVAIDPKTGEILPSE